MADSATSGQVYSALKVPGYRLADFRADWAALTDADKDALKRGVGNGSMTY